MTLTKQNIEQQETFISTYEKYLRKFSEDEKKARLKDIKESYVTLNVKCCSSGDENYDEETSCRFTEVSAGAFPFEKARILLKKKRRGKIMQ